MEVGQTGTHRRSTPGWFSLLLHRGSEHALHSHDSSKARVLLLDALLARLEHISLKGLIGFMKFLCENPGCQFSSEKDSSTLCLFGECRNHMKAPIQTSSQVIIQLKGLDNPACYAFQKKKTKESELEQFMPNTKEEMGTGRKEGGTERKSRGRWLICVSWVEVSWLS